MGHRFLCAVKGKCNLITQQYVCLIAAGRKRDYFLIVRYACGTFCMYLISVFCHELDCLSGCLVHAHNLYPTHHLLSLTIVSIYVCLCMCVCMCASVCLCVCVCMGVYVTTGAPDDNSGISEGGGQEGVQLCSSPLSTGSFIFFVFSHLFLPLHPSSS